MLSGIPDRQADQGSGRLIADRYLLHDMLGRGGMGTVWRAHDQLLDRQVAAKELHIAAGGDEEHRVRMRRAVREARAVARVPHPHVIGVHDLVEYEDRLWIVMELVQGPSLADHVARTGPLTPQYTAALGLQLLDALGAVHVAGTLHRDVKPGNVLLRPDGGAVLTDFGIAALDDGEFLTSTGQLVGSIEYMAPERALAQESGPESDLWSLGATLVTVCGGQSPFLRPAYPATLHAVVYDEPVLPEQLGPLRPVVEALLRKAPGARPAAGDVAAALRRVAAGETDTGPLPAADPGAARFADGAVNGADTVTGLHRQPVRAGDTLLVPAGGAGAAGGAGGTAVHTAVPVPARRRPGRRRKWPGPVLAGAAALAVGVGGGLFLVGAPPFQAKEQGREEKAADQGQEKVNGREQEQEKGVEPPAVTSAEQVVAADVGWQPVKEAVVREGDSVTVRFREGEWTVDSKAMPMTGPTGYDAENDRKLEFAKDCKVDPEAPFGTLLTRLSGAQDAQVRPVGDAVTFQAAGDGMVELRVNDGEGCLQDNQGELTVSVEITHTP
ncbi:serine/threonine-protein kinase [Streptomyces sp. NEAU-W12]|uniref:serine/threonine-protein kinase n=1 Tax=Streptomyces sp. NEAU-W12 TaxID=2994668 RepID=UPI00224AA49E|nr:serine/threonine-protein kinase [Streptomyces sp. NEAU-W12]MCX2923008.1 serine/threonine-protein kinase [Streptomyces sp. NEAU-W12]